MGLSKPSILKQIHLFTRRKFIWVVLAVFLFAKGSLRQVQRIKLSVFSNSKTSTISTFKLNFQLIRMKSVVSNGVLMEYNLHQEEMMILSKSGHH